MSAKKKNNLQSPSLSSCVLTYSFYSLLALFEL